MKRALPSVFVLALSFACATAQDAVFNASTDRAKVGTGEQFGVTFTVSAPDANGITNFRRPDFSQFVVLSGPMESTSIQVINGRGSASVSYSFTLYARQTGKYTIGSASIEYKGRALKTNPLLIEVVPGKPQPPQAKADPQQPLDLEDNVFIRVYSDRQRARQGEQIILTYKLYWNVAITSYDIVKAPANEGFWAEDFELPKQPVVSTEEYEGKRYQVATIRKIALFATQSGKLKVEPIQLRCPVQVPARRRSGDPFDIFFNDPFFSRTQTVEYEFKSNPLMLTIDALPAAPSGFTGAIGKFAFSAHLDKREAKAGDAVTLRLTISGTGNVKLLAIPKPSLPADLEAYDPKISEEISRDGGVIRGKKTAEYVFIPRNPGQRTIDPISFVYFDLAKNQYVTQRSSAFELNILPGRDFATAGVVIGSKEDVRLLGEDIRFLKLSPGTLRPIEESAATTSWFFTTIVIPPLLFVGALVYRKRMERISGDMPRVLFQKAGHEAKKRLKKARKLLAQGDTESYHAEILKALMSYLERKLQIPKASLSIEEALMKLRERGVSKEIAQQLRVCVERAEFARFAPGADTQTVRRDLLDAAHQAISGIEESVNGRR